MPFNRKLELSCLHTKITLAFFARVIITTLSIITRTTATMANRARSAQPQSQQHYGNHNNTYRGGSQQGGNYYGQGGQQQQQYPPIDDQQHHPDQQQQQQQASYGNEAQTWDYTAYYGQGNGNAGGAGGFNWWEN